MTSGRITSPMMVTAGQASRISMIASPGQPQPQQQLSSQATTNVSAPRQSQVVLPVRNAGVSSGQVFVTNSGDGGQVLSPVSSAQSSRPTTLSPSSTVTTTLSPSYQSVTTKVTRKTFTQHWIRMGKDLPVLLLDFSRSFSLLIPNIEAGKSFQSNNTSVEVLTKTLGLGQQVT
jgi:hypothetical protein